MNKSSLKVRIAVLALAAVPALALTSCSPGSQAAKAPEASAASFAKLFIGYHADSEEVDSPADLADLSDLVVRGTIVRIDTGRTQIIDADAGLKNTMLVATMEVDEVLVGELSQHSKKLVYIELPNAGSVDPATYEASLPVGAETVIYAVTARPGDSTLEDPLAGRPAGQPMLAPTSPQGFWMESGDGAIEVLEGVTSDDPVDAAVPASDDFPEGDEHEHED